MAEPGDYSPGIWSGHDFGAARTAYDTYAKRSYADAATTGKSTKDVVALRGLSTQSSAPFVVVCDVTGSMGKWPGVIFSKLPYLDHEARTE